jgi:hypothetical protein
MTVNVTVKKISKLGKSHTSTTSLMGGRLGVLKPLSGDSEQQCPFSADFGDILLPVIRHITKN